MAAGNYSMLSDKKNKGGNVSRKTVGPACNMLGVPAASSPLSNPKLAKWILARIRNGPYSRIAFERPDHGIIILVAWSFRSRAIKLDSTASRPAGGTNAYSTLARDGPPAPTARTESYPVAVV